MATQAAEHRVYRSRDAFVGGVCAGIAQNFDLDPIVVRILAIFITILTFGLGAVVYALLWARLPREPELPTLYEVTPESAESSSFGCVDRFTGGMSDMGEGSSVRSVSLVARLAVAVCLVLLFLLVATNVSPLLPGTEWWQFWPVGLLITGLCLIIVPIPTHLEAAWHALGVVVTSVSATMLPMSLGVMSWSTFSVAFEHAWALVLAAVALFLVGLSRESDALVIGSAFFITAFCLFALTTCAIPGSLEELLLHMPDGTYMKITFLGV